MQVCSERGCPRFAQRRGRCWLHARDYYRAQDASRPDHRAFYDSPTWRTLRAQVIAEEPICRLCGVDPSAEADHIETRRSRPDLALVRSNLRGACKSCHSRRTRSDMQT